MKFALIKVLSEATGMPPADVDRVINTAPRRYKVFEVPKRGGRGTRTIAQPSRELKALQRALVSKVLSRLPIHDAAHGFVKARGIRTNASVHVSRRFIMKLDLIDFFPSIVPGDFEAHLKNYPCDEVFFDDLRRMNQIIFWIPKGDYRLRLCIGAPSSPFISNTIVYGIDKSIADLCMSREVSFTRYADDMTFSTDRPDVLSDIFSEVERILVSAKYPKVKINPEKTVHASRAHRRVVTGVVLSNTSTLSLGRSKKRDIRAMVHYAKTGRLSEKELAKLDGLISFAQDIEPTFAEKMRLRLPKSGSNGDIQYLDQPTE